MRARTHPVVRHTRDSRTTLNTDHESCLPTNSSTGASILPNGPPQKPYPACDGAGAPSTECLRRPLERVFQPAIAPSSNVHVSGTSAYDNVVFPVPLKICILGTAASTFLVAFVQLSPKRFLARRIWLRPPRVGRVEVYRVQARVRKLTGLLLVARV